MNGTRFGIIVIFLGLLAPGRLDAQIRQRSRSNRTLTPPTRSADKRQLRQATPRVRRTRRQQEESSRFRMNRILESTRRRLFGSTASSANPIQDILIRRNRLRSRSILAEHAAAPIGHKDYVLNEEGRWRGSLPVEVDPRLAIPRVKRMETLDTRYASMLTRRLDQKADVFFELGLVSFRAGKYLKSKEYFKLVQQLEAEKPRAHAAVVLASYEQKDLNTALMSLIFAFERAETLEALDLDIKRFYPSDQRFQQVVDSVVILAQSANSEKHTALLLSYYAWLNGDLNTSIAATNGFIRSLERDEETASRTQNLMALVKRFRGQLIEIRDRPSGPETGG
ncbi:MAG: hypothetical protein ACE5EC_07815 [Phycisphaerae bacterium]